MVNFIKSIFTFSSAVQNANFWDCVLMFVFGAIFVFEVFTICSIIGVSLYSLGEFLKTRNNK